MKAVRMDIKDGRRDIIVDRLPADCSICGRDLKERDEAYYNEVNKDITCDECIHDPDRVHRNYLLNRVKQQFADWRGNIILEEK